MKLKFSTKSWREAPREQRMKMKLLFYSFDFVIVRARQVDYAKRRVVVGMFENLHNNFFESRLLEERAAV